MSAPRCENCYGWNVDEPATFEVTCFDADSSFDMNHLCGSCTNWAVARSKCPFTGTLDHHHAAKILDRVSS